MEKSAKKVNLTARVGRIQLFNEAGVNRASLSVCTETTVTGKDGKPEPKVSWHLVKGAVTPEVFGTHPNNIAYGDTVKVKGSLIEYGYIDKNGNECRASYIDATSVTVTRRHKQRIENVKTN